MCSWCIGQCRNIASSGQGFRTWEPQRRHGQDSSECAGGELAGFEEGCLYSANKFNMVIRSLLSIFTGSRRIAVDHGVVVAQ